jgi:hypothetical protein
MDWARGASFAGASGCDPLPAESAAPVDSTVVSAFADARGLRARGLSRLALLAFPEEPESSDLGGRDI